MSKTQRDLLLKNIIREISQGCSSKGHALSETLITFIVKAAVINPENHLSIGRVLSKEDVDLVINICTDRLLDTHSPSLDTIKMQVYFDMNYTSRQDFLEEHRRVLDARMQPVLREVVDSRARTRDELDSLYRKIVSTVLLRSGLGSPTDIAVVREATAALQSVFPQTELGTFMSLTKKDKERQLNELTLIVMGIRLFNKDCGKGGEGIDDLPAILNEAIPDTIKKIESAIAEISKCGDNYSRVVSRIHKGVLKEGPPIQLLKDALINARQNQSFLNKLLNDVIGIESHISRLQGQLRSRLEQLQACVQSKIAVPTAQVYPQFISLAHIWMNFRDEMVFISVLSNIMTSLEPFTRNHRDIFADDLIEPLLGEEEKIDESEKFAKVDPATFPEYEWLFPESVKNFDKIPIQYSGFCPWHLVKYDRSLVAGNPNIGVIRYEGRYYSFSTKEAAYDFAQDPKNYIFMVIEAAKRSPELIQLLELHQQFSLITPYSEKGQMIEKPISQCDAGCQTDTHILESNIVKDYEWNEWELRRKAIKLANLRTKLTKSMQTDLSNLRRDNTTQVYLPKENTTQTRKDGFTNVSQPKAYIAGLRGVVSGSEEKVIKTDLTLDIDVDPRTASGYERS